MKKLKLITSLSSLAVIGTTVPVVATSCSDNNYSLTGLNWSDAPTVGTTSYANQWYILKGGKTVVSHDDYEDIKDINVSKATSEDLGCNYDETTQMWSITPTKAGDKKLAFDITLNNGKKFTAKADILVNTNYPWTVRVCENCSAYASTKRVEINEVTQDATLYISAANIPSTATYVVHAINQDEHVVELEFDDEDGKLTIPANTFSRNDKDSFIVCSISIKNGGQKIGSTMYINITQEEETPPKETHGIVTFVNWDDVLNYLTVQHTDTDIPDGYNVPINNPTAINSFIYDHVYAETIAEGVMQRAFELLGNYQLKDSIVNWKTVNDPANKRITLGIAASFTVDFIDKNGVHSDKTLVFKQTLIEDTNTNKVASFEVTEETLMNGEITNIYSD